jgi:hypothetical protein
MPSTIAKTSTGIGKGNTQVYTDGKSYEVVLYSTRIYIENGKTISFDNGGWITPTTTRRMNQVIRHRGTLRGSVSIKGGTMVYTDENGKRFPFEADKLTLLI